MSKFDFETGNGIISEWKLGTAYARKKDDMKQRLYE